jgi:hypothetical protein
LEDSWNNPILEAFEDLSRDDNCLTIILGILFRNKRLFKFLTQRFYLAIKSRQKVLSGNLGCFFGEVNYLTIFSGNSFQKSGF